MTQNTDYNSHNILDLLQLYEFDKSFEYGRRIIGF